MHVHQQIYCNCNSQSVYHFRGFEGCRLSAVSGESSKLHRCTHWIHGSCCWWSAGARWAPIGSAHERPAKCLLYICFKVPPSLGIRELGQRPWSVKYGVESQYRIVFVQFESTVWNFCALQLVIGVMTVPFYACWGKVWCIITALTHKGIDGC